MFYFDEASYRHCDWIVHQQVLVKATKQGFLTKCFVNIWSIKLYMINNGLIWQHGFTESPHLSSLTSGGSMISRCDMYEEFYENGRLWNQPLADPRGEGTKVAHPLGPTVFIFMQLSTALSSGKSWIRHCQHPTWIFQVCFVINLGRNIQRIIHLRAHRDQAKAKAKIFFDFMPLIRWFLPTILWSFSLSLSLLLDVGRS